MEPSPDSSDDPRRPSPSAPGEGAAQPDGIQADPRRQALEAARLRQQREAARGCLLALVMEGAAILAAVLWIAAVMLELPRLERAGLFGFIAFTLAAAAVGLVVLIQGNLPSHRRLRQEHDQMLRGMAPADELAKNEPKQ